MATEDRKVQLEVTVDSTQAKKGFDEVKASGKSMADAVQREGKKAGGGLSGIGDGAQTSADKVSKAERSLIGSIERATAAMKAGGKAGSEYYEALAKQRGVNAEVLKPYLDQLRQAEVAQTAATASLGKMGMSAAATTAALRQVPAQFTDIVVSLQSGQRPMQVLLQQGGQLKDMFGGVGAATKALGGYVLGLINPLTLAAAAAGALALAYYKGSQEADNFFKAIVMSGNAAGTTTAQLTAMSASLGKITGSQAAASDALAQMAATGEVANKNLERFTEVAIDLEKRAGIPVQNTVKSFEELGRSPVEASIKLTEQYRYLTAEVYKQIKALQDQGRETEAAELAQKTFAEAMASRTKQLTQNLGYIQRGWEAVKNAASAAWNAMLNVGRADTLVDQIAKAEENVARLRQAASGFASTAGGAAVGGGGNAALAARKQLEAAEQQLAALRETSRLQSRQADAQAEQARRQEAGVEFEKQGEKYIDSKVKKQRDMNRELEKAKNLYLAQGDGRTEQDAELQARYKQIRDAFADKSKSGGSGINAATRRLDLRELQNDMREELAMVDAQVRALELRRQGGLISESEYYAKRGALIQEGNEIERKALQEQLDRLEQEKVKGKEALEVQRQISDVKAKLRIHEINSQNKVNENTQQAEIADKKRAATLAQLTQTHDRYIESLEKRSRREIAAVGLSDRERSYQTGRDSIEDRYLNERRKLEDQKMFATAWSPDDEAVYKRRLELLEAEQKRELELWNQTFAGIAEAQTKWELGAAAGLQNYADAASNIAGQVKSAMEGAFKGLEDALVDFVTKGKADFKSLAESIIADIARIAIRQNITGPIAQALSGSFSGGSGGGIFGSLLGMVFGGGRAEGGPVSPGRFYEVNERSPELLTVGNRTMLMMGNQGGTVTPTAQGGGTTVIQNFTVGDVASMAQVRRELQMSQRAAAGALGRSQTYGGRFAT